MVMLGDAMELVNIRLVTVCAAPRFSVALVAPLKLTDDAGGSAPGAFAFSVPALIAVAPPYVFVPESVKVPAPILVRPYPLPPSPTTAPTVNVAPVPTSQVWLAARVTVSGVLSEAEAFAWTPLLRLSVPGP